MVLLTSRQEGGEIEPEVISSKPCAAQEVQEMLSHFTL
jgi:hypothetical protein